jgi:hypothetical protein
MPVQYSINEGVLTMELVGAYESRDVVRQFIEAMRSPKCLKPVGLLVDVSRSDSLATRSHQEIQMVAEFIGPYSDRIGGRCAVIAPSDVHFSLSQMGATHSRRAGIDAQVFRADAAAREWLGTSAAGD